MVRAILDGRKTQTRRIIKPQPDASQLLEEKTAESGCVYAIHENRSNVHDGRFRWDCPFGQPGDRLWVRETFCPVNDDEERWIDYRATPRYEASHPAGWDCAPKDPDALKWKPSIHMPRWASRITLEITGVRVERLQTISQSDAIAEGAPPSHPSIDAVSRDYGFPDFSRSWFGQTWWSIYGEESWQADPWVWVIEFKRVEAE